MDIVIDFGNSRIKMYVFDNENIVRIHTFLNAEYKELISVLQTYQVEAIIYSHVSRNIDVHQLFNNTYKLYEFSLALAIPLENLYETPHSLGLDRIAAAVGAYVIQPDSHKLIIDLGTAITIDYVSAANEYIGGNISPGMETRFRALHEFTGKLPRLSVTDTISLTGRNTQKAIQFGVIQGILFELEQYISAYKTIFPDISVFLTGGDANYFEKKLKSPIFVESNLVAIGLHRILQYNV